MIPTLICLGIALVINTLVMIQLIKSINRSNESNNDLVSNLRDIQRLFKLPSSFHIKELEDFYNKK